jgi:hypothetical protein
MRTMASPSSFQGGRRASKRSLLARLDRLRSGRASKAFTLVELLVGVAWGGVVLGALGGALLVAQMRVAATMQNTLDTVDSVNRTIELIRREVTYAGVISTVYSDAVATSPTTDCTDSHVSLILSRGPLTICYKSLPLALLPAKYQSIFQGPCVLVRIGPPFQANGDVQLDGPMTPSAMLDRLGTATSTSTGTSSSNCRPSLFASLGGNRDITKNYRNANLTIQMRNPPGTVPVSTTYQFSVTVPSNPAYGGLDLYKVATCGFNTGCEEAASAEAHFKVNEEDLYSEIKPSVKSKENIIYLKYPYSNYTLTGGVGEGASPYCTYANCLVVRGDKQIQLYRIDAIVFTDREVRPAS